MPNLLMCESVVKVFGQGQSAVRTVDGVILSFEFETHMIMGKSG